jgi:hypothetical protein
MCVVPDPEAFLAEAGRWDDVPIGPPAGNADLTNPCSDPSQAASEVIAGVGGGAAVTPARVGVGGHQLGGDGGGGAADQSKKEYSDAKPELHDRPPIFICDSLSADAINYERFPNGAMWLLSRGAKASGRLEPASLPAVGSVALTAGRFVFWLGLLRSAPPPSM